MNQRKRLNRNTAARRSWYLGRLSKWRPVAWYRRHPLPFLAATLGCFDRFTVFINPRANP